MILRLSRSLSPSNVERSFNSLSVDGDMSTNDSVIAIANGLSGVQIREDSPAYEAFDKALGQVCLELTKAIARDGEGATRCVEVRVVNAASYDDAKSAAMTIANSPLVKTAIFGQDPNWGRVLCAAGRSSGTHSAGKDDAVLRRCEDSGKRRAGCSGFGAARKPMLERELIITVDLGLGADSATAFTCDFSYDYVKINAEYHT